LAASGIPGGGFLVGGWSPATALTLYWFDNLVGALAMAVRIALHRRWTGLAGHGRAPLGATAAVSTGGGRSTVVFKSFLAEFLVTSLSFTLAHGVFLAAVLGLLLEPPDAPSTRQGAMGIVICHVIALWVDTFTLDQWPFARLKQQASAMLSRVIVVHMTILGGMVFFAWRQTPAAFFSVFVWLKALADIGTVLPQRNPREPPRWLSRVMNRVGSQTGERFEDYWRRTRAQEDAQAASDERVDAP
jgi:Family of unknown function (DUF6498)